MRKICGIPIALLGVGQPSIALSASTVAENAAVGTTIGTLSLTGTYTGTPSYSLADDAGGKFSLTGDSLKVASALDYETATSHLITVSVSGVTPAASNKNFTITVTNKYDFTNSEAAAWVAAFTTEPSDADKGYYDTFVGALKAASIWTKIDVLWWLGGPDSQASRINAKDPGNLTLGLVNSPSFTAYRGFTGDGSTSYLTTGYNPSTFGGQYTLNSAHIAIYSRTSALVAACDMGCRVSASDNQACVFVRSTGDVASFRLNQDAAGTGTASTNGSGLFVVRRSASNAEAIFRNGSSLGTDTTVTDTIPNLAMFIGAINQNGSAALFSSRQYLFACAGSSLTDQNITDLNTAVAAFATSIGA